MKIEELAVDEITEYENNPRINDAAVDVVAKSITEFGFQNPILIDKNNVIIAGHTRLKAAIALGMKKVPTIKAPKLSGEQVHALRIMDNKANEYSEWDLDALQEEFQHLDAAAFNMELTGFTNNQLEVLGLKYSSPDLPNVDLTGAMAAGADVIIMKLDTVEHANRIRTMLGIPEGRKSITSTDFLLALDK